MNTHDDMVQNVDGSGEAHDDRLLWQLRGLRRDAVPTSDLWPGIQARISGASGAMVRAASPTRSRRNPARFAPWALAASLVLVVGVAWQQRPPTAPPVDPSGRLIQREAVAMTREYDAALRELVASGAARSDTEALRQLDQGAAQIRTALERDPDARFLLDRLRTTYEKRLALTQRGRLT